jgi:ABC-type nitrate/sulfonate/bicarbonate transport system ATPase subunit
LKFSVLFVTHHIDETIVLSDSVIAHVLIDAPPQGMSLFSPASLTSARVARPEKSESPVRVRDRVRPRFRP